MLEKRVIAILDRLDGLERAGRILSPAYGRLLSDLDALTDTAEALESLTDATLDRLAGAMFDGLMSTAR